MKNWRLYAILDKTLAGKTDLIWLAGELITGGADVIQLRDKVSNACDFLNTAKRMRDITRSHDVTFIVNDRVDIASASYADGVHLGQEDLSIEHARSILGKYKLVGISCHSLGQALRAAKEGADYIGLGPIFKTTTKPSIAPIGLSIVPEVRKSLGIPVVCIGGVTASNVTTLLDTGAETVAVASAIIKSNKPSRAAREIKHILEKRYDAVGVCQK